VRTARLLATVGGPECVVVLGNDPYGDPLRTQHAGRITPAMAMDDARWERLRRGAMRVARGVRTRRACAPCSTITSAPGWRRRGRPAPDGDDDPSLLGLCFDTCHWQFAGGDPVEAIEQYAGRICTCISRIARRYIADRSCREGWDAITSVGQGVFCELGGCRLVRAVRDALSAIGYAGWIVVEQDILPGLGTPNESAQRNRAYLSFHH